MLHLSNQSKTKTATHDDSILPLSLDFLTEAGKLLSDVDSTGNRTRKAGKTAKKKKDAKLNDALKRLSTNMECELIEDDLEEVHSKKALIGPRFLLFNPPTKNFQKSFCENFSKFHENFTILWSFLSMLSILLILLLYRSSYAIELPIWGRKKNDANAIHPLIVKPICGDGNCAFR